MRKVINGKVYDTETAEHVCDVSGNISDRGDFHYDSTGLYRTRIGQFFISGHGGPRSQWAVSTGQNSWAGGNGLRLVEEDDARALVERHADDETYVRVFGAPEEG
jgi:hypothetical protein